MGKDGEVLFEADVPATQSPPAQDAWVSAQNEDGERSEGAEAEEGEGPAPADRLDSTARDGRLRSRGDFQRLYNHGESVRGSYMVLIFMSTGATQTRRAFVASGKVGNAVARNRSKRLMREAYRRLRDQADLSGRDLVLVARHGCSGAQIGQVVEELGGLYRTAGLWKSSRGQP